MSYDFSTLSHSDFENLVRDLVGREFGIRFEAFTEGPDGGMDGRYAAADGAVVLQAKHYTRSAFSSLKSKMTKERRTIDKLQPKRYILATSASLTPKNKDALATVIGPWLKTSGDIFGPDDLNALLRKYPDIEKAHQKLWAASTVVLETVVGRVVEKALGKSGAMPPVLANLIPRQAPTGEPGAAATEPLGRDVIFLIKSSPIDDEFTLWLAPKLEAEGYRVFADILTLQPGDRWRRETNVAMQHRAAKVLLLCRDATLADSNVQDDLDIALELAKELGDKRFIIPLRLETGKKVKGIADALQVDFVRGWGEGFGALLETLQRQKVPRRADQVEVNPNWDVYRRRGAIALKDEPERLTSNWLRIAEAPDVVRYFETTGLVERGAFQLAIDAFPYPAVMQGAGLRIRREITASRRCLLPW